MAEIQNEDRNECKSLAIICMQCSLDRHLKNCILRDREFAHSRQQLEAKPSELRVKGYRKQKKTSHALSEADGGFLWQSGQLGKHSCCNFPYHYCMCYFYTLYFLIHEYFENIIVNKNILRFFFSLLKFTAFSFSLYCCYSMPNWTRPRPILAVLGFFLNPIVSKLDST